MRVVVAVLAIVIGAELRFREPSETPMHALTPNAKPDLDQYIGNVSFDAVTLDDALNSIRARSHANIYADWAWIDITGDSKNIRSKPVTVELANATMHRAVQSTLLAASGDLVYDTTEDGIIEVAVRDYQLVGAYVYDVRDLVAPPTSAGEAVPLAAGSQIPRPSAFALPRSETEVRLLHVLNDCLSPPGRGLGWGEYQVPGRLIVLGSLEGDRKIRAALEQLRRSTTADPALPSGDAAIAALMRRASAIDFETIRLDTAVNQLCEKYGTKIEMHWGRLKEAYLIEPSTPVTSHLQDVGLNDALPEILRAATQGTADPSYWADSGAIHVSDHNDIEFHPILGIYDIRDIVGQDAAWPLREVPGGHAADPGEFLSGSPFSISPEEDRALALIGAIMTQTGNVGWKPYGQFRGGVIRYWSGRLFVMHAPSVHREIAHYLEQVRAAQRLKANAKSAGG
ncbi:MAG TPA: hypothetical protein VG269_23855 [Tepidisphaeraceae bacterium]|jgi:hypothetical protein|nr:hypothetical protein [Tepidisphaeraceae bacterium]